MKIRIIEKKDGSVTILRPIYKEKRSGESDQHFLDRISEKTVNDMSDIDNRGKFKDIDPDPSILPNSREFRNSWKFSNSKGVMMDDIDRVRKEAKEREEEREEKIKKKAIIEEVVERVMREMK